MHCILLRGSDVLLAFSLTADGDIDCSYHLAGLLIAQSMATGQPLSSLFSYEFFAVCSHYCSIKRNVGKKFHVFLGVGAPVGRSSRR